MIHTDMALSLIRESFDKMGLTYNTREVNSEKLIVEVEKNNITLQVWFEVKHQAFGFNMLNGGYKAYQSIEEFEKFFDTYLTIQTEFLPNVKIISDFYTKQTGKSLAYERFVGNRNDGFRAIYYVLGEDNVQAHIYHDMNIYTVDILEFSEDKKMQKLNDRFTYKLNEDGTCQEHTVYDIQSYLKNLSARHRGSKDYGMRRTGANEFEATYKNDDITIYYTVEFPNNEKVIYSISEVLIGANRTNYDVPLELELKDAFDLAELLQLVLHDISTGNDSDDESVEEITTEEKATSEEVVAEEVTNTEESIEDEINTEESAEEETNTEESVEDEVNIEESAEEETTSEEVVAEEVSSEEESVEESNSDGLDPLSAISTDENNSDSNLSSLDEVIAENRHEEKLSGIDEVLNTSENDEDNDEFSFSPNSDETETSSDEGDDDEFSFSPSDSFDSESENDMDSMFTFSADNTSEEPAEEEVYNEESTEEISIEDGVSNEESVDEEVVFEESTKNDESNVVVNEEHTEDESTEVETDSEETTENSEENTVDSESIESTDDSNYITGENEKSTENIEESTENTVDSENNEFGVEPIYISGENENSDKGVSLTSDDVDTYTETNNLHSISKGDLIMEELMLKLVKDNDGNNLYVRFSTKDKLEDMSVIKARELGVPVNKITSADKVVMRHGIELTQEEIDRKIFSDNVTDDDNRCKQLVNAIFD